MQAPLWPSRALSSSPTGDNGVSLAHWRWMYTFLLLSNFTPFPTQQVFQSEGNGKSYECSLHQTTAKKHCECYIMADNFKCNSVFSLFSLLNICLPEICFPLWAFSLLQGFFSPWSHKWNFKSLRWQKWLLSGCPHLWLSTSGLMAAADIF